MEKLTELLLTVWALSEEEYSGPLNRAVPPRLAGSLRLARKSEMVEVEGGSYPYLLDLGCEWLAKEGFVRLPFTQRAR